MFLQCAPAVLPIVVISIFRFVQSPGAFAWLNMIVAIGMACFSVHQIRCFIRKETMHGRFGAAIPYNAENKIERVIYVCIYALTYFAMVYILLTKPAFDQL